jgi:hypothetical protein
VLAPGIGLTPSRRRGRGCCGRRRLCSAKGISSLRSWSGPGEVRRPHEETSKQGETCAALKAPLWPEREAAGRATHRRGRRWQRFVAVSRRVWHGDVRMRRDRHQFSTTEECVRLAGGLWLSSDLLQDGFTYPTRSPPRSVTTRGRRGVILGATPDIHRSEGGPTDGADRREH